MILQREGKAGYPGALKYWVKGVFQSQHTLTSVVAATAIHSITLSGAQRVIDTSGLQRGIGLSGTSRKLTIDVS